MKTPVVFIIFNRPKEAQRVFDTIRTARPEKLLVISDGPRHDRDRISCAETKKIIDAVDWPCDVVTHYSEKNVGCRKTLSEGLIWAFNQVDRAIVLEADCLPDASAYRFFEEMLDRYSNDEQVMHIGGNFFQHRNPKFSNSPASCSSYYFSNIPHIWGWATWSRAWKHYDPNLIKWPEIKADGTMRKILTNPAVYEYWETIWDQYYDMKIDSWDGQWTFACLLNKGLSITPTKNLVTNIGFGPDAIHTTDTNSIFARLPLESMPFPLVHPNLNEKMPNVQADAFTWRQNFGINAKLRQRIFGPIRRKMPETYRTMKKVFGKLVPFSQ